MKLLEQRSHVADPRIMGFRRRGDPANCCGCVPVRAATVGKRAALPCLRVSLASERSLPLLPETQTMILAPGPERTFNRGYELLRGTKSFSRFAACCGVNGPGAFTA